MKRRECETVRHTSFALDGMDVVFAKIMACTVALPRKMCCTPWGGLSGLCSLGLPGVVFYSSSRYWGLSGLLS